MKKLILIISFAFLLLQSCSSDDNNNSAFIGVKLNRVEFSSGQINTFNYDGNKIFKIYKSSGGYDKYSYQGNLIKLIESFNSSNNLVNTTEHFYNNNKLIRTKEYNPDNSFFGDKNYIYNGDNTINLNEVIYNNGNLIEDRTIKLYINSQGNIYKKHYLTDGYITNILYDSKNSPFKNITGYCNMIFEFNNVIQSSDNYSTINYSYQYNSENYPISKTINSVNQTTGTIHYFYE